MDHLGLERADVMGYSMGARITAFLASRHPPGVRSAVLGGLGIHLVDGVGPAHEHRRCAGSAVARRRRRSGRPHLPRLRRADPQRPRGARCLHPRLAPDARPRRGRCDRRAGADRGRHRGPGGRLRARAHGYHSGAQVLDIPRPRPHAGGRRQGVQGRRPAISRTSVHDAKIGAGYRDLHRSGRQPPGRRCVRRNGPPVLLLHGGGQTRHSWRNTAEQIVASGSVAYALDQRGHGDSDWIADGELRVLRLRRRCDRRRRCAGGAARARRRWWSAPRSAASPRCWQTAPRRGPDAVRRSPPSSWSTSRRASTPTAWRRSRASCARMRRKGSARSARRPTRSPPICRTGRARVRTRA